MKQRGNSGGNDGGGFGRFDGSHGGYSRAANNSSRSYDRNVRGYGNSSSGNFGYGCRFNGNGAGMSGPFGSERSEVDLTGNFTVDSLPSATQDEGSTSQTEMPAGRPAVPGNTLKIPDSEIQRRVELARRSEFSGFCRPVVDNDITFWMNKNLEADILAEKSQCDTIFRLLKSLGPMFTILKKLWNGKQLGGTAPVQVYAFNEEHKADNFHNLVRFIKDFCYAWGKPRPIHESGGILDFLFLRNGPVDHNNLSRF